MDVFNVSGTCAHVTTLSAARILEVRSQILDRSIKGESGVPPPGKKLKTYLRFVALYCIFFIKIINLANFKVIIFGFIWKMQMHKNIPEIKIYLFILFFASMIIHSNISKMTIKSVIPSGQHNVVALHQRPLTVLQYIL